MVYLGLILLSLICWLFSASARLYARVGHQDVDMAYFAVSSGAVITVVVVFFAATRWWSCSLLRTVQQAVKTGAVVSLVVVLALFSSSGRIARCWQYSRASIRQLLMCQSTVLSIAVASADLLLLSVVTSLSRRVINRRS